MADETTFYDTEGILARERPRRCGEILHDDGVWRPYPQLNPLYDARAITRQDAVALLPQGSPASLLDAAGEMDGQIAAPLRP